VIESGLVTLSCPSPRRDCAHRRGIFYSEENAKGWFSDHPLAIKGTTNQVQGENHGRRRYYQQERKEDRAF